MHIFPGSEDFVMASAKRCRPAYSPSTDAFDPHIPATQITAFLKPSQRVCFPSSVWRRSATGHTLSTLLATEFGNGTQCAHSDEEWAKKRLRETPARWTQAISHQNRSIYLIIKLIHIRRDAAYIQNHRSHIHKMNLFVIQCRK